MPTDTREASSNFWSAAMRAIRNGTSLYEEIATITVTRLQVSSEDALTVFTPSQIAERLSIHVRVVRRWIADGSLKAKLIGRGYLITAASLKEFLGLDATLVDLDELQDFLDDPICDRLSLLAPVSMAAIRLEAKKIVKMGAASA